MMSLFLPNLKTAYIKLANYTGVRFQGLPKSHIVKNHWIQWQVRLPKAFPPEATFFAAL